MEKHSINDIGQALEAESVPEHHTDLPPLSKKTKLKVDIRLVLTIGMVYALSVIDRINIGSAKVVGMADDLKLDVGNRYSVVLLIFFPAYLLGELPSNLALVKFGVANTLSVLVIGMGCFTIGQGHINSWQGLAVMRFFLGLFEGGVFPAVIFLCASWWPRYEVHKRLALLYGIGLVSSAFAGLLAYAIGLMDGDRGWRGWRWIFTIEGTVTIAFGLLLRCLIDDFPDRATFLSEEERAQIVRRIEADRGDATTEKVTLKNVKDLKDWTLWLTTWMYFCNVVAVYGLAYFVPSIIAAMGHSGVMASLYSAPPYLVGLGFLIIGGTLGDYFKRRLPIILVQTTLGTIGLALMSQPQLSAHVRYLGIFLAIASCQANNTAILIFGQNNVVGSAKMNIASVLNISSGTISGIIGSTIYTEATAPKYLPGLATTMALNACLILTCIVAWIVLHRKNMQADQGKVVFHNLPEWRWTL
ncbi:major facilitator superfamily domain-containing protein [Exophiala viscosa]|uniref:Major facilitator superfamily domain-containing protein n=1 Tax=Exophiala viscosa TaxID=2486360 RepID=A0AAN6DPB5_9EURO|nr:major facilitator superfamily domain-containing protein [Exophiala viscosa]